MSQAGATPCRGNQRTEKRRLNAAARRIAYLVVEIAILAGVFACIAPAFGRADEEAVPIFGIKIMVTATGS